MYINIERKTKKAEILIIVFLVKPKLLDQKVRNRDDDRKCLYWRSRRQGTASTNLTRVILLLLITSNTTLRLRSASFLVEIKIGRSSRKT